MEISIRHTKEFAAVKLTGAINEDNNLADHLDQIAGPSVVIDLSEVERINSCGVRDWVNWIQALETKGYEIFFTECSPSIVAQVNLVNNFTGNGRIKSIYVPYFCEACNREDNVLYEAEDLATPDPLPPASRCSGCERLMDFDDMPDAYFAFLSNRDRLLLGDAAAKTKSFSDSKKSIRVTKFAKGSTPIAEIDKLLETTAVVQPESLQETAVPAIPQEEAESSKGRAAFAVTALLMAGAGALTYVLL